MKSVKLLIALLIGILTILNVYAVDNKKQIKQAKDLVKEGIINWDESKFFQASGLCERVFADDENPYAKYYQALAQANILQKAMVEKNNELFNRFYEPAIENANYLKENTELKDEAEVLLAHIYMSKLSVTPDEAPVIAGKVYSCLEKALGINPENPRAIVIKATMLFYTPEMFGGDIKKAIELFEKAKSLYTKQNDNPLSPDWGYLDLMATLGMAYTKSGNLDEAKAVYTEALSKEPNYGRIKFGLLPQLEKQLKERK